MPRGAAKIAVSLPDELYRALESARQRSGKSRSGAVQEAVRQWLLREARGELVREYEAGYRRLPESGEEIEAALATAVCAVNLDTITTIPKRTLARRIASLPPAKLGAVERALRFALGLV